jgi:DNA-binding transcriptional LysR family regulator
MDLKRLQTFVAIAECGTVSKAAVRLHTAQPALSRQIIDLEKELGIALFDRIGRRLRLTGEGEQFLGNCRRLLGYVSSLTDQVHELRRGDGGVLKVTASPQMIDNVFSTFLHRYAKHYPNVQVRLIEGIGTEVLAMVERGEAQLGTVAHAAVPALADHFGRRPLLPVTFSAVYHTPFELGRRRAIDIRDLAPYPLLVLAPSFVLRKTFDAACRLAHVRPNIVFECSSPHTLLSLAEAGHGIAVVPSNVRFHSLHFEGASDNAPAQTASGAALDLLGQAALAAALRTRLLRFAGGIYSKGHSERTAHPSQRKTTAS